MLAKDWNLYCKVSHVYWPQGLSSKGVTLAGCLPRVHSGVPPSDPTMRLLAAQLHLLLVQLDRKIFGVWWISDDHVHLGGQLWQIPLDLVHVKTTLGGNSKLDLPPEMLIVASCLSHRLLQTSTGWVFVKRSQPSKHPFNANTNPSCVPYLWFAKCHSQTLPVRFPHPWQGMRHFPSSKNLKLLKPLATSNVVMGNHTVRWTKTSFSLHMAS